MRSPLTVLLAAAVSAFVLAAHPARPDGAAPGLATVALHVEGMTCPSCKAAVRTAITRLPGVKDAKVDVVKKSATVEYDASKVTPQQVVDAVNRLGYAASLPAAGS
jgi:copper chaperone CopZ